MNREILQLMIENRDSDNFDNIDKFPKNVQDIIDLVSPEYSSEDIACLNRFEIDEIENNKLKMYSQEFIDILTEFTEDGINSLEELNRVYIRNYSGKLDMLSSKVKKMIEGKNIDLLKVNIVDKEDLIADILQELNISAMSINKVVGRICSKI